MVRDIFTTLKLPGTPLMGPHRSYRDAVLTGVMTPNPQDYFDADVCVPYTTPVSSSRRRHDRGGVLRKGRGELPEA